MDGRRNVDINIWLDNFNAEYKKYKKTENETWFTKIFTLTTVLHGIITEANRDTYFNQSMANLYNSGVTFISTISFYNISTTITTIQPYQMGNIVSSIGAVGSAGVNFLKSFFLTPGLGGLLLAGMIVKPINDTLHGRNQLQAISKTMDKLDDNVFNKDNRYRDAGSNKEFLKNVDGLISGAKRLSESTMIWFLQKTPFFKLLIGVDKNVFKLRQIEILNVLGHYYCQNNEPNKGYDKLKQAKELCQELVGIKETQVTKHNVQELYNQLKENGSSFAEEAYTQCNDGLYGVDKARTIYLPELYSSILYSFARVYFYNKKNYEGVSLRDDCLKYLEIAKEVCSCIKKDQNVSLLLGHQINRNGLHYLALEGNDVDAVYSAIAYYQTSAIAEGVAEYYEQGTLKTVNNDSYNQLVCYNQKLKCYTKLLNMKHPLSNDEKVDMKSCLTLILTKLQEQKANNQDVVKLANFYNTIGDYYLELYESSREDFTTKSIYVDQAKDFFISGLTASLDKRNYTESDAYYGLTIVYKIKYQNNRQVELLLEAEQNIRKCMAIREQIYTEADPRRLQAENLTRELDQSNIQHLQEVVTNPIQHVERIRANSAASSYSNCQIAS